MGFLTFFSKTRTDTVRATVARKKIQAMRSGIPQLVNGLYHSDIRYYPAWSTIPSKNYVPTIVEGAHYSHENGKEKTEITLDGHHYTFLYDRPNLNLGDGAYRLELLSDATRVFLVEGHLRYIADLKAFVRGTWINDFKKLHHAIRDLERLQKQASENNMHEIDELKRNFGIH